MIQDLKESIKTFKLKSLNTLIIGLILFGLMTLISKKSKKSSKKPQTANDYQAKTNSSSLSSIQISETYEFQLSIVKRSLLLELLELINFQLLEKLVNFK
jgi:hypothetical protein